MGVRKDLEEGKKSVMWRSENEVRGKCETPK